MDIDDLIDYLRLEGPYDLERIPTASEEDAPPLEMNLQMRRETLGKKEITLLRQDQ